MLGSLKKLFFKDTGEDLATSIPEPVAIAPDNNWPTSSGNAAKWVPPVVTPASAAAAGPEATSSELLSLPLQSILTRLPNSLSSVVQSQGNGFVSFPAQRIVQELPKGLVKIPFGELRQIAPPGIFFDNARHDQVLIELPLADILARLHPSQLSRRPDQKQIHVPDEITDIFGPNGEGVSLGTAPVNAPRTSQQPPTSDTAISRKGDTAIRMRTAPPPNIHTSPTAVVPPTLQVVEPEPAIEQLPPIVVPLTLICEGWPEMVRLEILELNLKNKPVTLPFDELGKALKAGKIIFTWKQICAWMQPPVESISAAQDLQVELPLQIIAPLYMAKHRATTAQKKLSVSEIPDLFAMKPAAEPPAETPQAHTAAQPSAATPKPVSPISPIPFVAPAASKPAPLAAPTVSEAPVAAPVAATPIAAPALAMKPDNIMPLPKPAEAKPALAPEPAPAVEKPNAIGEIFNQPARHNWTPNEVLKHLANLPGVAGSFLTMQDGLLVAAELPAQFKAETMAAFLPQIFGRMNQYTKELQMGGLSSMTFVVNEGAWQIVKSGGIYLVALCKPGENVSSAKLNSIAAELSKKMQ